MNARAVFYEEADAVAVAGRLRADGFGGTVSRERFAGEDDDEDHPWAVDTDAPGFMVEVLAEQYDGWVLVDEPTPEDTALPGLPDAPRRVRNPGGGESPTR